jgi:hypothetical protein
VNAPRYFRDLRDAWNLNRQNLVIPPQEHGSDPVSVVRHALKVIKEQGADAYDTIYCLVDRDRHPNFNEAEALVRNHPHGKSGKILFIVSNPCFEVWTLAHFTNSTRQLQHQGQTGSDCNEAIRVLKTHMPSFSKGDEGLYASTVARLDSAKTNAKHWEEFHSGADGNGNPSTSVYKVIEHIEKLRLQRQHLK